MGMYNEVYWTCIYCRSHNISQITQLVNGFGEFDLDKPSTIDDNLMSNIVDSMEDSYCQNCGERFNLSYLT
jgi:hypothetical protein